MTEIFKQMLEAAGERIRSPFFGSIFLVFLGFNWREVFYLLFAHKPVRARILYFDANTDVCSLIVYPVVFGVVAAIVLPWTLWIGAKLARLPKEKLHELQFGEVVRKRIHETDQKAEEEEAIARLEAAREQRKIDAAIRLNEAGGLSLALEEEIGQERKLLESPTSSFEADFHEMGRIELKILSLLVRDTKGNLLVTPKAIEFADIGENDIDLSKHRRTAIEYLAAINWLDKKGYINITNENEFEKSSSEYSITEIGYKFSDFIDNRPPF